MAVDSDVAARILKEVVLEIKPRKPDNAEEAKFRAELKVEVDGMEGEISIPAEWPDFD